MDGAHKTLPTLTQGATVNVNNEELIPLIEEALSMFRTTSPSYPIMASVEYGVKYLANNASRVQRARSAVKDFERNADEVLPVLRNDDWTKLLIDFKQLGVSPEAVALRLEKKGIYPELTDGRYMLFYLSPMTEAADLNALYKALSAIVANKKLKGTYEEKPSVPEGERSYSFQYALRKPCEYVPLTDAVGRMCARNAGLTPPCIPVVVTGEIVTAAAVKCLSSAKTTFGITDGKICVVKK